MQLDLIDLTPQYLQSRLHQRGEDYFAAYPALFQHYYQHWAAPNDLASLPAEVVREKVALLKSRLPAIQEAFSQHGFAETIPVVLFVGANTTNGHAFWDASRQAFVVSLPIEAYATPLQVDIFVTHEVIHALHYTRRPEFYFHDPSTQHLIGRQIITEGLATWGTLTLTGSDDLTALWADYVPRAFAQRWDAQCQARKQEMAQRILKAWNERQEGNDWFAMWDPEDVTRYRGGYYIGLQAIRKVHQEHALDLQALLSLARARFEELTLAALQEIAAGHA